LDYLPGEDATRARMIALRAMNLAAVLDAEPLKPRKAAKYYASVVQNVLKARAT